MALPKHFLSNRISQLNISKVNAYLALVIGVFSALALYSLFNVSRDVFRLMSFHVESGIWSLTSKEIFWYNLFYAYVSSIFGQTIAISFLLHKSKPIFTKRRFRVLDIQNHHQFYSWNIIHWLVKVMTCYGILFYAEFNNYNTLPDYRYFYILLVLVLFFGSWNSTILIFRRLALKILFVSAVSISILSLGLSQINLAKFIRYEKQILKMNIHYNYEYEKVESEYYRYLVKRDIIENIYIVFPKDGKEKIPVIVHQNKEYQLSQLLNLITTCQSCRDEVDSKFMSINLCIHKDIPMGFVNKVKFEISNSGIYKISYSVIPENEEFDQKSYSPYGISLKLPPTRKRKYGPPLPKSIYENFSQSAFYQNCRIIRQISDNIFEVNGDSLTDESLKGFIKNELLLNKKVVFINIINNELRFESYLKVIESLFLAGEEIKNNYSLKDYGIPFNELREYQAYEIYKRIRLPLLELYPEFVDFLMNEKGISREVMDKYIGTTPGYNQ